MKTLVIIALTFCSVASLWAQPSRKIPASTTSALKSVVKDSTKNTVKDTSGYTTDGVTVTAQRAYSAATDNTFRSQDLQLLPRNSAQDLLRIVPGLVIAQHAGGGKAEQIFLRGFDCDHGTDVNISVDGAPVNMVSHGHGQGYADLHFIIPEVVERMDVVKGPYFASYGDLTTAGAVTFHTADSISNSMIKIEGGSFGVVRGLGLFTGNSTHIKSYVGAEIFGSRGYFDAPQDFRRVNFIAKTLVDMGNKTSFVTSVMHFASGWNASGQIPARAVESGVISRFGSIDPTEGGNTQRTTVTAELRSSGESPFKIAASYTNYDFRLFSNFTFFRADSLRGDMIEQTDNRSIFTVRAEKEHLYYVGDFPMRSRFGVMVRSDDIHAALHRDSARIRYETTSNAAIRQSNIGIFAEQEAIFGAVSILAGARADYFGFDVVNLAPRYNPANGQAQTVAVSPKLNVTIAVDDNTSIFINSGFGFHSNDARAVVARNSGSILPRALGAEIGGRWANETLAVSAAAWMLNLENEFVWVGDEGTTEENGRSRRVGIDLEARIMPVGWLTVGADATISHGRLLDLPDGANLIPLAPSFTLTAFATARMNDVSIGLRLRNISSRPANEDNTVRADGYAIFDGTATYAISERIEVFAQCENILNAEWREAQFDTESRLRTEPSPIAEIHYTPGSPRSFRLGFGVKF